MLTQSQVDQFHANGFLNGGKCIGDEEVDVLRAELDRVIENQDTLERKPVRICNLSGKNESPVWQIVNIWEASNAFKDLMFNRKLVEDVAQLTEAQELRIWHDQIQYKPAAVGGVNMWHQDAPLWPIILPMTEVSAWVALDDVDESNGCMSMIPGSHKWGDKVSFLWTIPEFEDMPDEFEGHKLEVRLCPVKKGEVHYHHSLTWHGSHANLSGRPRRAIAYHYMTQETYYVESGGHPMKPFVDPSVKDGDILKGEHFPRVYPVDQAER